MLSISARLGLLSLAALGACSGQIYHQAASSDPTVKEKGVKYYDRFLAKQYFQYTKHASADGKVDDVPCDVTPAYTQLGQMVDLWHPQIIYFEHGFLENYKFDPHVAADGTLSEASAESNPDRLETFKNFTAGLSNIAGAVKGAALLRAPVGDAAKPKAPVKTACNTNAVLYTFERIDLSAIPTASLPRP